MKKEITAVICVLLAVWFFFMGFELGIYKERKASAAPSNVVTVPTVPSSTEPTSVTAPPDTTQTIVEPSTEAPATTQGGDTTSAPTTKASDDTTTKKSKDPSGMSKEEVISAMEKAFKTVKAEQNMTATKSEDISIQLTDLSVKSLMNTVNNVIQGLAGAEQFTYTFTNGTATAVDGEGKPVDGTFTMDGLLPPDGKDWTCNPTGIKSAKATKNGDATTYEIVLVEENTTFTEPVPPYSAAVFGHLDLTTIDLPVGKITDANMHYKGTNVTVTVDGNGKVTDIHYNMPMDGYGAASLGPISGNASFEGYDDEVWHFSY